MAIVTVAAVLLTVLTGLVFWFVLRSSETGERPPETESGDGEISYICPHCNDQDCACYSDKDSSR